MKMRPFQIYLSAIILLAAILSAYIAYGQYNQNILCIAGGNCSDVQNSEYGEILGIKVSVLGTISFMILFFMYRHAWHSYKRYRLYYMATSLGFLISLS